MRYLACFGDSLVYGFPFGPEYSWLAHAQAICGIKMLNYGVCGDCCDDILERLRSGTLPEYVRHVLFLGGANDILQRRPHKVILGDLLRAAAWCEARSLRLCLVLPLLSSDPELNVHLAALRQKIQAALRDVFVLDVQQALGFSADELRGVFLDGVHPTARSYKAMGEYAAPLLEQWLRATAVNRVGKLSGQE